MTADNSPAAVLIVQPARLGDVLLSTALLDDLHRAFPSARLDFLTRDNAAPLLEHHPVITRRLRYTKNVVRDVFEIRGGRYDWVIDPHCGAGSAQRTLLSGAHNRAGYAVRVPRRYAYTHHLTRSGPPQYSATERKGLLRLLGVEVTPSRPRIFLTNVEREAARTSLRGLGVNVDAPVLGISLLGKIARHSWTLEGWAAVTRLARDAGMQPVVFAAPGEAAAIATFRAAGGTATVVEERPIREFVAMIACCSAYASPNTGPSHFAMALRVPTATVYAIGRAQQWNPRDADTIALEAPLGFHCPECLLPKYESGDAVHACLASITAEQVVAAIQSAMAARQSN